MNPSPLESESVGQLFWVGLEGPELSPEEREALTRMQPGGVVLFRHNVADARQVTALIRELRRRCPVPPIVAIDEEGGAVERLQGILPHRPPLAWWRDRPRAHFECEVLTAIGLRTLGLSMNLHPVVDLAYPDGWMITRDRCLAEDARVVRDRAEMIVEIYRRVGLLCCLKHFPGLGRGREDTHEERTVIAASPEELWREDLGPYRGAAVRAPAVMVAHAEYPAFEAGVPASLSTYAYDLLRRRLRFRGLALTDDMSMKAVALRWTPPESARLALASGADGLLFCREWPAAESAWLHLRAAWEHGRMRERIHAAVRRVLRWKRRTPAVREDLADASAFRRVREALARLLDQLGWAS